MTSRNASIRVEMSMEKALNRIKFMSVYIHICCRVKILAKFWPMLKFKIQAQVVMCLLAPPSMRNCRSLFSAI